MYHSKKIGLLDITLTQEYPTAPSLDARILAQKFLKALVLGKYASLYLYMDPHERMHYFLERDGVIIQLFNYSYYRKVNFKVYLLKIEKCKEQLRDLAATSPGFQDSLPLYQEKFVIRYIANFNRSFPDHETIYRSEKERYAFDLDLNMGVESWNEVPVVFKGKLTFGVGMRVNIPGKFNNRFLKANFFLTPNVLIGYDQAAYRKVMFKTYEIAVGSYFGRSRLRPYIGVLYSKVSKDYRFDFLGLQGGISLDRRFNLEIGHFANFASIFTGTTFMIVPRISLHYLLDLNFNKKSSNN